MVLFRNATSGSSEWASSRSSECLQPTQADGRHVGARARLLPSCFRADFADSLFLASQLGLPGV